MISNHTLARFSLLVTIGLLAAGPSIAGVPYWVVAAGNDPCSEPNPPPSCNGGGCNSATAGGGGCGHQGYGQYFMSPPPIAGIVQDTVFTAAALEDGQPATAADYVLGVGLVLHNRSVASLLHPASGELLATIVPASAGLQIAAISAVAQKEAFDILTADNSIYRFDLRSQIILPVALRAFDPAVYETRTGIVLAENRWLLEAMKKATGTYVLRIVEDLGGGTLNVMDIGAERGEMLKRLHVQPDPMSPFMAVAVDASGEFLGVLRDFDLVQLGTRLGFRPSAVAITADLSSPRVVVYATDDGAAQTSLHEADPFTGSVTTVGAPRYLRSATDLAVIAGPLPDARWVVVNTGTGSSSLITVTNPGGERCPNFPEMKASDLLGHAAASEVRTAMGQFGLIAGDPTDLQLFVSEYDRTKASTAAAELRGVSMLYRDDRGLPALLVSELPFGGANKAGQTPVRVRRGDGRTDAVFVAAGPSEVYGPQINGYTIDAADPRRPRLVRKFAWYAYGTPKWGANATAGDLDGDGIDEILSAAGPGTVFGAHVRGWTLDNLDTLKIASMAKINFFAFGSKGGANVACADLNGDGKDDIAVMPGEVGPNGGQLRGFTYGNDRLESLPLNMMLSTSCSGGQVAGLGDAVAATLGRDTDASVFVVRAKMNGQGYDVSSWSAGTSGNARVGGGIIAGRDGLYVGGTTPYNWQTQVQVWGNLVTHWWQFFLVDDSTCYRTGTAVFHLGNLPLGGAPIDGQGNVSFTAYESQGLPYELRVTGQFKGKDFTGTLTLTDLGCGWSKQFAFSAKR